MLKISLIACGHKMPTWVNTAVAEFSKRLRDYVNFQLIEIPLAKRQKGSNLARILEKETNAILAAIPEQAYLIALESSGQCFTSEQLAAKLQQLQQKTSHLCLLIGGPEGLSPILTEHAQERWSLSALTMPHPLVRIVLTETLYRAFSIIHHHPYHK